MIKHREFEGKIKSYTISKTRTNKYYILILVEKNIKPIPKIDKKVDIDLGVKDFVITSDEKYMKIQNG